MMETIHEHRPGGLKQQNKPHKHGRHRSKGSLEKLTKGRALGLKMPGKKRHDMRREERRNQAAQTRQKKRFEYLQKRRGLCEAPFLVTVLPLNEKIDVDEVVNQLKEADPEATSVLTDEGHIHLKSPRLKHKFTFALVRGDNLFDKLDLLKVSTTVLLLASVEGIDEDGQVALSSALAQGLPTVTVLVTDLASLPQKKWHEAKSKIESDLCKWLPPIEKVSTIDKTGDGLNVLRKIALQKQKSILQRDRRPHLMAESTHFSETDKGVGTLKVTGFLRGVNLSVNSLVHIPGWGDFQMSAIELAPFPGDDMSEPTLLEKADPSQQESLENENIPDPMDAEQTWPTEEEIAEAEKGRKEVRLVKKVPRGFSEYQAAWIPDCDAVELEYSDDDEDDEGTSRMEAENDETSSDDDTSVDDAATVVSEAGTVAPEKYDNEMDLDEEKTALEKTKMAKEDKMFPDEVDTPHDVPARKRFAKFRGLRSFRTSPWDPKENLPYDYARIFQFQNFQRTKAAALSRTCTGALPGQYVSIYIEKVPSALYLLRGHQPLVVFGLLQYENKMSVVNVVLKRTLGSDEPIASKEKLFFQVGFRRFRASPIFSQHTKGNKHKYERFFHPEAVVVASMYAPITYPPASVLVFKENKDRTMNAVAHGSVLSVDPNRVVVKRIALSGHPKKIMKRWAIIRFMFFNREDIDWFKPIELKTKHGRRGHIKEALGTHGHMKCVFNAQLRSEDTVMLNLYKRVFPKWTYDPNVNFVPIETDS